MKALKGLLIYVCILLGLAFVGATLLFCGGFFFNLEIAGYGVVKNLGAKEIVYNITGEVKNSTIDMKINAGNYKVNVISADSNSDLDHIKMYYKNKAFGVYVDGDKETKVTGNLTDNTVNINIAQPSGFVSFGDSYLSIYVPASVTIDNLIINTLGGDVTLKGSDSTTNYATLNIKNIAVTTGDGDFTNTSGITTVEDTKDLLCFESLKFDTVSGSISFGTQALAVGTMTKTGEYTYALTNVGKLTINADSGVVTLGEVFAELKITGDNMLINIDDLYTLGKTFNYDSKKGTLNIKNIYSSVQSRYLSDSPTSSNPGISFTDIDIDSIGGIAITTENANLDLNRVTGDVYVNTTYGNVNIKEASDVDGEIDITTIHGNVTVEKAKGNVIAESTYGDIKINEYYKSAYLTNRYGKITAYYKGVADYTTNNSEDKPLYMTKVKNTDGDVYLYDIATRLSVQGIEKTNVNVTFAQFSASVCDSLVYDSEDEVKTASPTFDISVNKGKINLTLKPVVASLILNVTLNQGSIGGKINQTSIDNNSGVKKYLQSSDEFKGVIAKLTTTKGAINIATNNI